MNKLFYIFMFSLFSPNNLYAETSSSPLDKLKLTTCVSSDCKNSKLSNAITTAIASQSATNAIVLLNAQTAQHCSSPVKNKTDSFLGKENYAICSIDSEQSEGAQPVAFTFIAGHKDTPDIIMETLKEAYTKEEIEKLKGRTITAFAYIEEPDPESETKKPNYRDKFKINSPLKKGSSTTSLLYGNDHVFKLGRKVPLFVGAELPDDQGLTGGLGLSHVKVLGNGLQINTNLNAELRTMRFGKVYRDEQGRKTADQWAKETTTLSVEVIKHNQQLNNFRTSKGVSFKAIDVNADKSGFVKSSQEAIHDQRDMLMPNNISKENLSERKIEVAGLYAINKFYHTLNSNCFINLGADMSAGFTVSDKGKFEQSHSLSFNSSVSKYFPKLGVEASVGAKLKLSIHNLSDDSFVDPSEDGKFGTQLEGAIIAGVRKGKFGTTLEIKHQGNKGLDDGELYYQILGHYYVDKSQEGQPRYDLSGKSPNINKAQLVRPFQ